MGTIAEVIDGRFCVYGNAYIFRLSPQSRPSGLPRPALRSSGGTGGWRLPDRPGPNGTQSAITQPMWCRRRLNLLHRNKAHDLHHAQDPFPALRCRTTWILTTFPFAADRSVNQQRLHGGAERRRGTSVLWSELAAYGNMATNVDFGKRLKPGSVSGASTCNGVLGKRQTCRSKHL